MPAGPEPTTATRTGLVICLGCPFFRFSHILRGGNVLIVTVLTTPSLGGRRGAEKRLIHVQWRRHHVLVTVMYGIMLRRVFPEFPVTVKER